MSALQLKKEENASESRCPSCGAGLPDGAVLCVQCGYDIRSGRRVDEEAAPRANPLMIAGVALLVAVAVGLVAWRILASDTSTVSTSSVPVVATSAPPPAAAPVPVEPVASVPSPGPAVAQSTGTVFAVAEVPTNEVPAPPVLDPAVVEAEQRVAVIEQLDQMVPLYEAGDEVELRLTNGLVQRGAFVSRSEQALVVQVSSNQTRTLEFILLDRGSRVRSDPQYRTRYIDFHAQQRAQKIIRESAGPGTDAP